MTHKKRRKLSTKQRRRLAELVTQANNSFALRNFERCRALCDEIDAIHPDTADCLNLRGMLAAETGHLKTAATLFQQAIRNANPKQIGPFYENLAMLYLSHRQPATAVHFYRTAMRGKPWPRDEVAADYAHALCETVLPSNHQEAVAVMERLTRRHAEWPSAAVGLSEAYQTTGQLDKAESVLTSLLEHLPHHRDGTMQLAELYAQTGRIDAAVALLEPLAPTGDIQLLTKTAELKRFKTDDDPLLAAMVNRHQSSKPKTRRRMELAFALGKAMDDIGNHDAAFRYWKEGNDLQRIERPYQIEQETAHLDAIANAYQRETVSRSTELDDSPIFIVGMPRCGSTLTERILASHPDVLGKGECGIFSAVALPAMVEGDGQLTLDDIASFSNSQLTRLGELYINNLMADVSPKMRVVDKSLGNFALLGLIHAALPQAKIIHVKRNPLDQCLSIYRHSFEGNMFDYGNSLEDLGRYYLAYQRLMAHWHTLLPSETLYELQYEQLIENQEEETRKLINFCGLEWDDACLAFHRSKGQVKTASIAQVRQPIYKDSMAGWRRYERHLEPLIKILQSES